MRHCASLGLGILLAAGAMTLATQPAVAEDGTGDPAKGATAFAQACTRCHRNPDVIAPVVSQAAPERVDAFLATHFARDATLRADIIAYLLSR